MPTPIESMRIVSAKLEKHCGGVAEGSMLEVRL